MHRDLTNLEETKQRLPVNKLSALEESNAQQKAPKTKSKMPDTDLDYWNKVPMVV